MVTATELQPSKKHKLTNAEIEEIQNVVMEIRGSTGWGSTEITIQNGDIAEIDVSVKRKLKCRAYLSPSQLNSGI
jgi:hypothetical protein